MTNYTLIDLQGLCLATAAEVLLLAAPGMALVRFSGAWRGEPAARDGVNGLLAGLAVLPLLDSLVLRQLSLGAALGLSLILAATGLALAVRDGWRPRLSRLDAALLLAWFVLVAAEWADFDTGRALYQPYLILDTVKHAATVQGLHDTGAPLRDPFFLRPGRSAYYYFFYTPGAVAMRFCAGLADARACYGGLIFWTGVGFYNLLLSVLQRAALVADPWRARVKLTLAAVTAVGGLDILPVLKTGLTGGGWPPDPVGWNEPFTGALESILWTPHHVTSALASLVGFMALAGGAGPGRRRRALFAAAALASAFGCSVWVACGAALTGAAWFGLQLVRRRAPAAAVELACVGLAAAVLTAPQLLDLHAGRAPGPFPVAFSVRPFGPIETLVPPGPALQLVRLLCLPLSFFAGLGLLAAGAALFFRARKGLKPETPFAEVLALSAASGLLIASLFRSTLYNNDLGWRVILFPIVAALAWTVAALVQLFDTEAASATPQASLLRAVPGRLWALGAIGLATTLYMLVNARTYEALPMTPETRFFAERDARTERDLRTAYGWADRHLPRTAVLQHDPAPPRVFPFGLYGRNPTAVADSSAGLYGAAQDAVMARGRALSPLFAAALPPAAVAGRARASGVDVLVVDAEDPVWRVPASWVWTSRPLLALARVRLIPVSALGTAR